MRINNNLMAMNTHRQLGITSGNGAKSIEKLSAGLRINRAGDDAAGLAISEKMRAQIRGLSQASRNAQDSISMIQTAEGALSETHDILQRMRELATQAANDTNVAVDRGEIQKEMNQLTSEINRIGNTTEFNTQKLLKGTDSSSLASTGALSGGGLSTGTLSGGAAQDTNQAKYVLDLSGSGSGGDSLTIGIGGQNITITFGNSGDSSVAVNTAYNVTATTATVNLSGVSAGAGLSGDTTNYAIAVALSGVIANNSALAGNVKIGYTAGTGFSIEAVSGGTLDGVGGGNNSGEGLYSTALAFGATGALVTMSESGTTTAAVAAQKTIELSGINTAAEFDNLVGKGITIDGKTIEFYDANDGAYTGTSIGVNISDMIHGTPSVSGLANAIAEQVNGRIDGVTITNNDGVSGTQLVITASEAGTAGNAIAFSDGGVQTDFTATFQVGSNQGQSFSMTIGDMRATALGLTGTAGSTGFTNSNVVTDGTSSTLSYAALDVSSATNASSAITAINSAIESVSAQRSSLGAFQNRLEHTIKNLDTSSENLQASESRIRDVDMAKEMMNFTKNNILQQAAQAMLAQANQAPQGVLQLLR